MNRQSMLVIVAWVGTITSIAGAFMVALGILKLGYCAFLLGSASWLFVAASRKDRPLLFLNLTFFGANIIGLARNF